MTRRHLTHALALGLAVACATPRAARAQAVPDGAAAARGRACFQARPMPRCRSFWITEFGVLAPTSGMPPYSDPLLVVWELGRMYNVGQRRALGASVMFATGDDVTRLGVKGRYRAWLNDIVAAEVAPGIILSSSDTDMDGRGGPGFVMHGAISLQDWVTMLAQMDVRRRGTATFLGAKLGSLPGTIVGVALSVVFGALLAIGDRS